MSFAQKGLVKKSLLGLLWGFCCLNGRNQSGSGKIPFLFNESFYYGRVESHEKLFNMMFLSASGISFCEIDFLEFFPNVSFSR